MSASEITTLVKSTAETLKNPNLSPRDRLLDKMLLAHLNSSDVAQIELLCAPFKISATAVGEPGKAYLSLMPGVMLPHSRGSIHISSPNPLDQPVINPQAYTKDVDKKMVLAGMRFVDKVARTMPLKQFLVRRIEPAGDGELTEEQWWDNVKKTTEAIKHPIGTCSMLPRAKGGVVDHKLRVYGVKGLRVVDASIMPLHVAAHIQATVYAVAEKAASLILNS